MMKSAITGRWKSATRSCASVVRSLHLSIRKRLHSQPPACFLKPAFLVGKKTFESGRKFGYDGRMCHSSHILARFWKSSGGVCCRLPKCLG